MPVTWSASDPDGDPLHFDIQYSTDNGATWEMIAQNLTGTSHDIETSQLPASTQALIRVWATDGIHTASDQSNGTFTVPNHAPTVAISDPSGSATITEGQTLGLEAQAYDADTGTVPDAMVAWSSSLGGALGTGKQLSVDTLSIGTHTVTVTVNDGQGGIASATVQVVVGPNTEVPAPNAVYLPALARP